MTDLATLIEKNLPPQRRQLLVAVSRVAAAHNLPLYLVAGTVRDLLLGLPPGDFDFVTEGSATVLARALARELGGDVVEHAPFKTATWTNLDGATVDFATARTETYPRPAALPVVTPAPIAADLRRRDFTVNALALRVDGDHFGELLDLHQGQADLAARAIRVLHPASFQDDPTRLFRAVRYEQRLGFHIASDTLSLLPGAWPSLATLTSDRLRHEFELIFRERHASAMLTRLAELNILPRVHPALHWSASQAARALIIPQLPFAEWRITTPPDINLFYWTLLLEGCAASETSAALQRLNVPATLKESVTEAVNLRPGSWSLPSEVVSALDPLSEAGLLAAYVLHEDARKALHNYLARWRFIKAATSGDDLKARGLKPGPAYKHILWQLRAARLDATLADAAERDLLERLLLEL